MLVPGNPARFWAGVLCALAVPPRTVKHTTPVAAPISHLEREKSTAYLPPVYQAYRPALKLVRNLSWDAMVLKFAKQHACAVRGCSLGPSKGRQL